MPLTVAICDDNENQIKELRRLLDKWSADKPFVLAIDEYISAESFLFSYRDKPCDLLLLDIEMKRLNGMELARKLRERGDMLPIVFITGYSDYISEGYDVEALHYLLKPIAKEKLFAVLDKYVEKHSVRTDELLIETDAGATHISTDRITYIEAFGRKTGIHFSDGTAIDCTMSISSFSAKQLKGFVSCHRSYIVNLRYIRTIVRTGLILDNGEEIPLSRRLYSEVNRQFIHFYTDNKKDG